MDLKPTSRISIELSPEVILGIQKRGLNTGTVTEQVLKLMRYALIQMFPPRTLDEWKHLVSKEEWRDLVQAWRHKSRGNGDKEIPIAEPCKLEVEVPANLFIKIEELAHLKQITVPEAAEYTIEYALKEVFPPRTGEELKKDVTATWRAILREIFRAPRKHS